MKIYLTILTVMFLVLAIHWFEDGQTFKAWIDLVLAAGCVYFLVRR